MGKKKLKKIINLSNFSTFHIISNFGKKIKRLKRFRSRKLIEQDYKCGLNTRLYLRVFSDSLSSVSVILSKLLNSICKYFLIVKTIYSGSKVHPRGSVVPVKVLGALALIDEGETDWKIVTIDVRDPLANEIKDLARFLFH